MAEKHCEILMYFCRLCGEMAKTKFLSEIDFVSPARTGDVIEIGLEVVKMGRTSITIRCEARVKKTQRTIIRIEKMVFVNLDENLKPLPHNKVYEE